MSLDNTKKVEAFIIDKCGEIFKHYGLDITSIPCCIMCHKITKIYKKPDCLKNSFQMSVEQTRFTYNINTVNKEYIVIHKERVFTLNKKVNRLIFLLETLKSRV